MRKATTSIATWAFQKQHVQQNLVGGDFVGSHSCLLCVTGPRLEDLAQTTIAPLNNSDKNTGTVQPDGTVKAGDVLSNFAIPIGVVDSASMQQDRQIAQIFEIGSKRSYILASRVVGVMNIARVFYKGPNLLRMLYAHYPKAKIDASAGEGGNTLFDHPMDSGTTLTDEPIGLDDNMKKDLTDIKDLPGYHNVWFNLNSDIFSYPYGMVLYIQDNNTRDVAAVFLEECYVQNHQFNMSANQIIVAENVTMRFERVVPIKVNVVDVNSSGNSAGPNSASRNLGAPGTGPQ